MSVGEFDIIDRYFKRRTSRKDILLGIGDDAAVLAAPADKRLVIAMDTIVAGVHFPHDTLPADIGYRALAVNLSDLAAMGAQPSWMTLSLSSPTSDTAWLGEFSRGLFELADRYDVALVGGDTVKGPLAITIQLAGYVEPDKWLTRSGARAGDLLFVSGTPGDASAGLAVMQRGLKQTSATQELQQRFLRPQPRVQLGRALREFATAAMDISDGLLTDLDKLCAASRCGARVDIDALPLSTALSATFSREDCLDFALAGGDDYELLFTVPPDRLSDLPGDVACTRIAVMTQGGVDCWQAGQPITPPRRGYDHFAVSDIAGSHA